MQVVKHGKTINEARVGNFNTALRSKVLKFLKDAGREDIEIQKLSNVAVNWTVDAGKTELDFEFTCDSDSYEISVKDGKGEKVEAWTPQESIAELTDDLNDTLSFIDEFKNSLNTKTTSAKAEAVEESEEEDDDDELDEDEELNESEEDELTSGAEDLADEFAGDVMESVMNDLGMDDYDDALEKELVEKVLIPVFKREYPLVCTEGREINDEDRVFKDIFASDEYKTFIKDKKEEYNLKESEDDESEDDEEETGKIVADFLDEIREEAFDEILKEIRERLGQDETDTDEDEIFSKIDDYLDSWEDDPDADAENAEEAKEIIVGAWDSYIEL